MGQGPATAAGRDQTSPPRAVLCALPKAPSCSPSSVQPTGQKAVLRLEAAAAAAASPGPELPRGRKRRCWSFPQVSGLVPGGCQHLVCGTLADDPALHAGHSPRDFFSRGLRRASCATVACVKPLQSQGWNGRVGESGESRTIPERQRFQCRTRSFLSTFRSKQFQHKRIQTCWPVCLCQAMVNMFE